MIENPLANPHLPGTAWRLGTVLAVVVAALLWRHWRTVRRGAHSPLAAKALTVVWVAPVLLLAVFAGAVPLALVVAVVVTQSVREYAVLARLDRPYRVLLTAYCLVTLVVALAGQPTLLLALPPALVLVVAAVPILTGRVADAHRQLGAVVFGHLYIGLGLSVVVLARQAEPWGLRFLVVAGTAVVFADAGAYLFGNAIRGPRLAPSVSPQKTWSGVGGAVLGVAGGLALQWPLVPDRWGLAVAVALAVALSVGAVWGDLVESVVKRDAGVKDAGTVLPGFGGLLDRFDSFLLSIPLAFAVVLLLTR
ncbi:phosphatidate cytidylyltransferase [Micromonospora sp. DT48]|uniref:phosphatidate cytidylyltransferase n=1 Tax=unclassified Micromonospora TaxID=2617518 RepID=UPI0012BC11B2|nr:phosphatidate cytidylyltransferase [Micromonospora sp. CP22]MTK03484.1 phosphatidate cytidylyltransferase [Micromonospora sp. CP22]